MLVPSGRYFRGPGKGQTAQIISRGLRLVAGGEKGAAVGPQETNPGLDVASVAQIAVNRELGTEEGRAQLGDQFLCRIRAFAKAVAQITVKARLMPCPVPQFVERSSVKMRGLLKAS